MYKQDTRTIIVSACVGASVVAILATAPAVGQAIANYARNSDKVDGRHAVGSDAPVAKRRGKLVATSRATGRLPNGIIARAPNANRLDGKDSKRFALRSSLNASGTVNDTSNPVHWTKLKGVPGGLADGIDAVGPFAYAHVSDAGTVDADLAYNWDDEDVAQPSSGAYCFTLSFTPKHISVTPDLRLASDATVNAGAVPFATFSPDALADIGCAPEADALIIFRDGTTRYNASFFVSFM